MKEIKKITHHYKLIAVGIFLLTGLLLIFFTKFYLGDRPPALSFDTQGAQGFLNDERFFFRFEESDLNRTEQYNNAQKRSKNIQYYYSENNISFEEIINSIKPDLNNRCMIISYLAQAGKFHIYPEGPFKNTTVLDKSQLSTFELSPAHSFVIVCKQDYETINIKHASERPSPFNNLFDSKTPGWHLNAFSSDDNLKNSVSACYNRTKSIWVQDGDNSFRKTDFDNPQLSQGYFLAWIKLEGEPGSCSARGSNNSGTGGSDVDNSNDGNNSSSTGAEGRTNIGIYDYLKQNYQIDKDRLKNR